MFFYVKRKEIQNMKRAKRRQSIFHKLFIIYRLKIETYQYGVNNNKELSYILLTKPDYCDSIRLKKHLY